MEVKECMHANANLGQRTTYRAVVIAIAAAFHGVLRICIVGNSATFFLCLSILIVLLFYNWE